MYLRYLHYLRLVVEHGSFAGAARAGGITQPAISYGMAQLQKTFDTPLFLKSGRRLMPTETALRVAWTGQVLVEHVETLAASAAAKAPRDTLRVGLTSSASLVCGPALHDIWCQAHSRRRLDLSTADEGRMLARLQGGELDLVISPLPRSYPSVGLTRQPLYQIAPLVYARKAHPLAKAQSIIELQAAPWAIVGPSVSGPVDVLSEAFAVRRLPNPRVTVSCPDYASLLHLMGQADLLAVLPHPALLDSGAKGQIVPLRLRENLPRYAMHLFAQKRPRRSTASVIAELKARLGDPDIA